MFNQYFTDLTETGSNNVALGLGIGLGVGIPILLCCCGIGIVVGVYSLANG